MKNNEFINFNPYNSHLIILFLCILFLTGCNTSIPTSTKSNEMITSPPLPSFALQNKVVTPPIIMELELNSNTDKNKVIISSIPTESPTEIPPTLPVTPTVEPKASSVTLLAVGDNLIHLEVIKSGLKKDGTYRYDHLYSNIKEDILAADIAIINQETILGGKDFAYTGYPSFNSPTEIGDAIAAAGFDVILHATNHTMDKGKKAVENTMNFWRQFPEITVLGINETKEISKTVPIVEKNGIKIAMLNYTYGLNGYSLPKGMPYYVNLLDKQKMSSDIKKAKKQADFVIVFPHWGSEYVYKPNAYQKDLTRFFYQQGVDLVIGTHPHVIQPVEWIKNTKKHKMLVYYSLGNFMSYQKEAPRMLGAMANITLTKDKNGTYISEAGVIPIVTHYEHGPKNYNFSIYKLTDYTSKLASVHGVSDIAKHGPLTYKKTYQLAVEVLSPWFQ